MLYPRMFKTNKDRAIALMLGASLCTLSATHAAAVTESFAYPNGPLQGAGTVGAWTGPWQAGTQSVAPLGSAPFQVQSDQLKVDLTDQAKWAYSGADVYRTLASPIATSSVYISFQITPGEMGVVVSKSNDDGYAGLNLAFADGATNIGSKGPMFSIYEYFQDFGAVTTTRISTSLDGIYDESKITITDHTPGVSYQLVGRLDFNASGADDRWTVWLNPTSEASVPQVVTQRDLGYTSIARAQMWYYIYNFTSTQDTYLDNLRIGSTWASVNTQPADLDADGDVDDADFGIAFAAFTGPGGVSTSPADLDNDGDVDDADFGIAFAAFTGPGGAAVVPEPASLIVLSLCLTVLTRRTHYRAAFA